MVLGKKNQQMQLCRISGRSNQSVYTSFKLQIAASGIQIKNIYFIRPAAYVQFVS